MGTVDPTCGISPHDRLGGSIGSSPWRNGAMGCRKQSLERAGSIGILPNNLSPFCEEDFVQSEETPGVASSLPIYQASKFYDSADFQSEDFTVSMCSSTAYSFAPIKPAVRDILTDLEAHEITTLEKTKLESRRAWSTNGPLLSDRSRSGERRIDTNDTLWTDCLKTRGEDTLPRQNSSDIFATASPLVDLRSRTPFANGRDQGASYNSDVSLCHGCPAKEQSAQAPALQVAGPQVTFWDIDSRGSTGLNFVFVDDYDPSNPNNGLPEECVTSCTSTTVDSLVLNSMSGKKVLVASSTTSVATVSCHAAPVQIVNGRKIVTDLDVDASNPFYGLSSPKDNGYAGLFDVSFDFVSNTVSTDQDNGEFNHSLARTVTTTAAGPEYLRGFLKNQRVGQQQASRRASAEGDGSFCPCFMDLPSCDNHSRSFSDSDVSEGRGRTIPGLAIYRNQLYEQRNGRPKLKMPVRVFDNFPSQDSLASGEIDNPPADSPLLSSTAKEPRFRVLETASESCESERQCFRLCDSGQAGSCSAKSEGVLVTNGGMLEGDLVLIDRTVDNSPQKMSALVQSYSVLQASSPEIEATEDDDNYLKRRMPSHVQSRGQLYDSSRSWMSQLTGNSSNTRLVCVSAHPGTTALLVRDQHTRGCPPKRRFTVFVVKNLAKLFACFKG